jgi:hypothetical protein
MMELKVECRFCKYGQTYEPRDAVHCHRFPPTILKVNPYGGTHTDFTVVKPSDWCGEFALASDRIKPKQ